VPVKLTVPTVAAEVATTAEAVPFAGADAVRLNVPAVSRANEQRDRCGRVHLNLGLKIRQSVQLIGKRLGRCRQVGAPGVGYTTVLRVTDHACPLAPAVSPRTTN